MTIVTQPNRKPTCAARSLTPQQRLDLALQSLGDRCCVSPLAQSHLVSRKFVYQQQNKALRALDRAFDPPDDAPEVLCWLRRDVLGVAGRSLSRRQEDFDFVLSELTKLRTSCQHRLAPFSPRAPFAPDGAPAQPARRSGCTLTVTLKCPLLNHARKKLSQTILAFVTTGRPDGTVQCRRTELGRSRRGEAP